MERPSPCRFRLPEALAVLVLAATGCARGDEAPSPLSLVEVRNLAARQPLALNDDVVLTFDAPLDPTTITGRSVRLVAEGSGRVVEGRWIPEDRVLRFRPRLPLDAALETGGFRPGDSLRLTINGYPAAARLRSVDGRSLARSVVVRLDVAGPGDTLLRDASPADTKRLRVPANVEGHASNLPLPVGGEILMACDEPLDPRTLDPQEFELVPLALDPLVPAFDRDLPAGPIPIRDVALVENEPEGAGGALLRVVPARAVEVRSELRPEPFELRRRPGSQGQGLADFSGGAPLLYRLHVWFAKSGGRLGGTEGAEAFEFDFLDSRELSPMLDPASDGMAYWDGTGRVEIRYPRAAGDGRDGAQVLGGRSRLADLHATRIAVPAGEELRLEGDGLIVLRAQGRIEIDGSVVRRLGGAPKPMWTDLARARLTQGATLESLSQWLERARAAEEPWTVIVAGGNLVVRGELDLDTPLLLVAGGWIRGVGRPRTAPGQFWMLGSGGGFSLPHQTDPTAVMGVEPPLSIDPPLNNPLREPLSFVAISSPAPKSVAPTSWRPPEIWAHEPGGGASGGGSSVRVQYLAAGVTEETLRQAVRHDVPMGAVDPSSGGQVRLRIELTARPSAGPWDPPFLDRVRLSWNPLPRR